MILFFNLYLINNSLNAFHSYISIVHISISQMTPTTGVQFQIIHHTGLGARCSSVVRAFAHGAMGRRIDPSWGGPIELFLVPASAPRLV